MGFTQHKVFQHVDWTPDRRELRQFAVAMLVGFFLIGLMVAWRRHQWGTATYLLWGIGLALAVGGLLPGIGRAVYLMVYLPTSILGFIVSHLLLTLIYFFVFTPIGLLLRLAGKDPLRLQVPENERKAEWIRRDAQKDPESYYHQF